LSRTLNLVSSAILGLFFCLPVHGQDSPSLGDVARQAQKDKSNKPASKVFTNEDMPSGSSSTSSVLGDGADLGGPSRTDGNTGSNHAPAEALRKLELTLDHLDSLDKANLALEVLAGNESKFPGRARWEEKLFNAKQAFVAQTRTAVQKTKQLTAAADQIKDPHGADESRIKNLSEKLDQLAQETRENGAAFDAVIQEGKLLAEHSASH